MGLVRGGKPHTSAEVDRIGIGLMTSSIYTTCQKRVWNREASFYAAKLSLTHSTPCTESPGFNTMQSPKNTQTRRPDSPEQLTQDATRAEFATKQDVDTRGSAQVRRGFLSLLCFVPAVQDPRQYTPGVKWGLTFIVAMGGLVVPLSSGVLFRKASYYLTRTRG